MHALFASMWYHPPLYTSLTFMHALFAYVYIIIFHYLGSSLTQKTLSDQDLIRLGILSKLHKYSHKWRAIGMKLGFTLPELDNIEAMPKLFNSAPTSFLDYMLSSWVEWAPGDARGSTAFATLDALRTAVDKAGLGLTAQEL